LKFEQVLKIYWSKSFLYGGITFPFDTDWRRLNIYIKGVGTYTKLKIIKRFEMNSLYYNPRGSLIELDDDQRLSLNRIFSKMNSLYSQVTELNRLNIIRLFLIKSFRGKAQAFGKPSRGQRTWSNAWTSYLYNKDLRIFIAEVQKKLSQERKVDKINYKLLKKKLINPQGESKKNKKKQKSVSWF
jgi:ribosomal protein S13